VERHPGTDTGEESSVSSTDLRNNISEEWCWQPQGEKPRYDPGMITLTPKETKPTHELKTGKTCMTAPITTKKRQLRSTLHNITSRREFNPTLCRANRVLPDGGQLNPDALGTFTQLNTDS